MGGKNQELIELQKELIELREKVDECEKKSLLYENILNQLDEAIYSYDKECHLVYMNSAAEKLEGKNREGLIGKKEREIWDTNVVLPMIEKKEPIENERMYYKIPSGKEIHIVHSVYPIFENNEITGCFSITKDVTQIDNMIMNIYELQRQLRRNENNKTPLNGTRYYLKDIIGESEAIKKCIENAYKVSKHKSNILIYGETGTGKEMVAQGIHNSGINCNEPFIGINCSAIPGSLIESLLFGTKQGAFTGALDTKGLFEQAGGGTLFLDEVNSMPLDMQSKLLRVLQEKRYRRIGDNKDRDVNCRVISATNIEPAEAVKMGQLRQDLYYRIATVTITIPPLRERASDIHLLINYFTNKYNKVFKTLYQSIDSKLIEACCRYSWPGNVRELEHMVESALNLSEGYEKKLQLDLFPVLINNAAVYSQREISRINNLEVMEIIDLNKKLNDYEIELIKNALINNRGNMAATARQLSIHRSVLYNKMKKLDMDVEELTEYVLK